ncbi:MAG: solute:sodium symporter family transporter [Lentisphaerae bacterium]|nr:solute:sodium symporter family transporter [Lentisphaerota bacterium]MCP4102057.1 solute:sodium symporter family transporter [Lentisphaerota bacterium]
MQSIIITSFLGVIGLVGLITWLITRKDDHHSNQGYFLGGRSLTFPIIAGSLLLTNLSTEQMVGLNGLAFRDGLCVMAWEVIAVIALVAMALFFLPRFLKSGIATVPEFLEIRFDHKTRVIANMIFLVAYTVILIPIILYSGAMGMSKIIDIKHIFGLQSETAVLWTTVWMVGCVGMVYALWGGLRTCAVADTLNGVGLLIGGFMITYFGLNAVSGGHGVWEGLVTLKQTIPGKINSIGGAQSSVPFSTIFTGVLIINMFYWCTNQQIIQRTFGASSLAEGQKGVLLTAFLKLIGPLYLVLPGIIAFYLFSKNGIKNDAAYGTLVRTVLPPYLAGFFAAVMIGAILSSFNGALNSTCTLFSLGLYKNILHKNAKDHQVVRAGKIFGFIIGICSMIIAPMLAGQDSIFGYLQKMNGIYFIPIFAVVLVGMLSKKVNARAAKIALITGCSVIALGYFVPPFKDWAGNMHDYHFVGMVFFLLVLFMVISAKFWPREVAWVHEDAQVVDMTPWKYAGIAGAVLLVVVISIYAGFAHITS